MDCNVTQGGSDVPIDETALQKLVDEDAIRGLVLCYSRAATRRALTTV